MEEKRKQLAILKKEQEHAMIVAKFGDFNIHKLTILYEAELRKAERAMQIADALQQLIQTKTERDDSSDKVQNDILVVAESAS